MTDYLSDDESIKDHKNFTGNNFHELDGGKKRRKRSSKSKSARSTKRKGTKRKGTRKKGPSKWIMHVKAFCRKTGKNFPQALKDPMCRKTFKH